MYIYFYMYMYIYMYIYIHICIFVYVYVLWYLFNFSFLCIIIGISYLKICFLLGVFNVLKITVIIVWQKKTIKVPVLWPFTTTTLILTKLFFFSDLQKFIENCLDQHKHELALILYPVFVHMYLELVYNQHEAEAIDFMYR